MEISHKKEEREEGSGAGGQGPLAAVGGLYYFGYLCRGSRVPSYAISYGAGLPT